MIVAYWTNGLGEEMSSRVYSEFHNPEVGNDGRHVVVWDWRSRTFLVLHETDCIAIRNETPR